jgi:hypothetical protein
MNAQVKLDHNDVIMDHISLLSKHEAELTALKASDAATSAKVTALDKDLLVVKTKITAYATLAVFVGNVAFQVVLRLFF